MSTPKPCKLAIQPKTFSGTKFEDAEQYIIKFNKIADCNLWTADMKMNYFLVSLEGVASSWYEGFERKMTAAGTALTWAIIEAGFKNTLSSLTKAEIAEQKLAARKQLLTESPEEYLLLM